MRVLSASLTSLDHAARPWRLRALERAHETQFAQKLRRIVNFGCVLALVSAAMMAALILPERDHDQTASIAPPRLEAAAMPAPIPEPALQLASLEQADWQAVRRPVQLYHLEGPEVEGTDLSYQVSSRGRDARRDLMSWRPRDGREESRPTVIISVERFEGSQPTQRPFFADMASRASEQHLALERLSEISELRTKFGPMQVAEGLLKRDDKTTGCTLFRRLDTGGLVIAGWYCAPAKRPLDRVALSCFLNRLDLVSAGRDQELKRHFAEAERQRGACVSARQSGRRITWLDHEAPMPALKLSAKGL